MTDFVKEIFDKYQVRKSKKTKDAFISRLRERYPELTLNEGGLGKNRNIILGDPEKARVLLTAHYDTCAGMFFPNLIFPLNKFMSVAYGLVIAIPMIAIVLAAQALTGIFTDDYWVQYWVSMACMFSFLLLMMAGPANKHTANDNTSGVVTVLTVYDELTPEEREKACVILFDNEELGLLGSSHFRKTHKDIAKNKLLVNFDCVSDGDNALVVVPKKAQELYGGLIEQCYKTTGDKNVIIASAEKAYYPSDQKGYTYGVAVSCLNKCRLGLYMDKIHTAKDTVFDERNIELLVNSTKELVQKI